MNGNYPPRDMGPGMYPPRDFGPNPGYQPVPAPALSKEEHDDLLRQIDNLDTAQLEALYATSGHPLIAEALARRRQYPVRR